MTNSAHSQHSDTLNVSENFVFECKRLNLKQKEISDFLGMSLRGVQRWCKDVPVPGDQLGKLVKLGFDPYFVVTGKRQGLDHAALTEALSMLAGPMAVAGLDFKTQAAMLAAGYQNIYEKSLNEKV